MSGVLELASRVQCSALNRGGGFALCLWSIRWGKGTAIHSIKRKRKLKSGYDGFLLSSPLSLHNADWGAHEYPRDDNDDDDEYFIQ